MEHMEITSEYIGPNLVAKRKFAWRLWGDKAHGGRAHGCTWRLNFPTEAEEAKYANIEVGRASTQINVVAQAENRPAI